MKNKKAYSRILKYLKEDKIKIIIAGIIIFISAVINISYGYLNGSAVEYAMKKDLKMTLIFFVIYLLVQLIGNQIFRKKSKVLLRKIELNVTRKMSRDVYTKIMELPAKAFEDKSSGELINRVTSDTETITELLNTLLLMVVDVFCSILVIFYVFYNSIYVGLEIIIYLIFIIIITKLYMPKMKKYQEEIKKETDKYLLHVNQSVLGIREIKILGIIPRMNKVMNNIVDDIFHKRVDLKNYETKFDHLIEALNSTFEVGVFITCAILFINDMASMTFFIAMTYYVYRYMNIVSQFSNLSSNSQKVVVAINRINEILDNELYEDEKFGNVDILNVKGNITFKNVTFGYDEQMMLNNFNLKIDTNKKVAIVGKSGQGKSTLFNLITRLFDVNEGEILIDDINIKDLTEESLRNNISIIRQTPFLFNKTIIENFDIVCEGITLDEVRHYCKLAHIDDYIMSLPDAYDTKIGEGGINLSGGQKQRIAIARALMKKSKIILFDEATSALDNESQMYIKKSIDDLASDHTVVIVAHRLSTIMDADIIYVVDEGQIKESGTHEELMSRDSIYKSLYEQEEL